MSFRLYRTSWLVAGVALIVALLTLQSPPPSPEAELPPVFDGGAAKTVADDFLRLHPQRAPGSPQGLASADFVKERLTTVLGATVTGDGTGVEPADRVQEQEFTVWDDGVARTLRNVFAVLPATARPARRGVILVVAPRDTPPGVTGGSSGTAVLVELARAATARALRRPVIVISTDGSTLGNAGIRWFLERNSSLPVAAAVVLDAPGEIGGDRVDLWGFGRTGRQALDMRRLAEAAVRRTGGEADADPSLARQLLRLAVPQTFGDQGALIARGIPAVTLAGREEQPLVPTAAPTAERLELVGRSAENIVGAIESAEVVPRPSGSLALAGRRLRPTVARLALLLLALPLLVLAVDGLARARRAGLRVGRGARALWWRTLPALAALVTLHLLTLPSLLPPAVAGVPPLPDAVALDGPAAAGLIATAFAAFAAWLLCRRPRLATRALPPEEAAAATLALAGLTLVLWVTHPYALALALPAAHAALLATLARRTWQLGAAAAVALLPLLGLAASIGDVIGGSSGEAAWYLVATSVNGGRGWSGPLLAVLVGACVWAIGGLVAFRARKGLVTSGDLEPVEVPVSRRDARR